MGVRLIGKYGASVLAGQNFAAAKAMAATSVEKGGEIAGVGFLVKA